MQIKDISDDDSKHIIQLHKILTMACRELKVSVADAKIIDESFQWFKKFATVAGKTQEAEAEARNQGEKTETEKAEGLSGVKIKDYNPGDLTVVSGGKKSKTTKSKAKTKGKKRK